MKKRNRALLSLVLLLARYSVSLAGSVTQPVVDLSRRAEDVMALLGCLVC